VLLDVSIQVLTPCFLQVLTPCFLTPCSNWYWLVDGLMEHGYPMRLVHTSAVPQYDGIKHGNDHTDAHHLAHLLRLGILPEGYIYPREGRALRDLLRRRFQLVHQSTA